MENKNTIVFITVPTKEVGKQIATALVQKKLAACVNILPGVNSIYAWEGKVQDEEEVLLIVKSRSDLFEDRLIPAVKALHPYEVPEIIAVPILAGLKKYLDWIDGSTM